MELATAAGLVGVIATVITSVAALAYWLGRKFSEIDARFSEIDRRFSEVYRRFDKIDSKLADIDRRLDEMDARFSEVDSRFSEVYRRFDGVDGRLRGVESSVRALAAASSESHRVVVDFLALKGLVERAEAEYLSRRIEGVFKLYTTANPLKREEVEFLKNFISKAARNVDEVTIEEAEKAYELGLRMFVEDADVRGFQVAMAATYVRGYLVSREVRKQRKAKDTSTPGGSTQ